MSILVPAILQETHFPILVSLKCLLFSNSGHRGLPFRRFICNIAFSEGPSHSCICWKLCYGLDLFCTCDQNASLPSDSKAFSSNFVLSLSFSSLPNSFCCLITTCIIIKLSLKSHLFLTNCFWGPFSFSQIALWSFLADSWLQILLEDLHHSEPDAEVIMSERHKLSTKAYTLVP